MTVGYTQVEVGGHVVEVDVRHGLPSLTIVGMPDRATAHVVDAVRHVLPSCRVTVNVQSRQLSVTEAADTARRALLEVLPS